MSHRPPVDTRKPGRRKADRWLRFSGCALALLLVVGLAVFVWWQLQNRLEFHVTSDPEGAVVTIGTAWGSYTTPADVSVLFDRGENGRFEVQAESGSRVARGRIEAFPGGFKSFTVHRVESLDGSAWVWNRERREVAIHYPIPGKFAFVHPFRDWRGFTWNDQAVDDYRGVVFMPEGAHEIEASLWSVRIEADEGFCVELRGPSDSSDGLRVSFEPDHVRAGSLAVDDKKTPFAELDQSAAYFGSRCRVEMQAPDGARCDLTFRSASPELHLGLGVRVTYGR